MEEFSAVSQESCRTPIINPTPTTCMDRSFGIPNRLQASGIRSSEPPATPDAPQALAADKTHRMIAVGRSTWIFSVWVAARVSVEMVIAAPPILMVAPRGMEMEYVSSSNPRLSHSSILTGILAAELRVKNAVRPLSRRHRNTSGYGLRRIQIYAISGFTINATKNIVPSKIINRRP